MSEKTSGTSTKPRVKIIAVARDEAFFLPQWVYHHFYMGFDAIDIYVNRTLDNSVQTLKKLERMFPGLRQYNADWVDNVWPGPPKSPSMQHVVYSCAVANTLDGFDYYMFLDIDEYWLPAGKGETVKDCLAKLKCPDAVAFEWFNVDGSDSYAAPFVDRTTFAGCISPACKCINSTSIKPARVFQHLQPYDHIKTYLLADGRELKMETNNFAVIDSSILNRPKNYFILHDWMRSPIFHLSNLANGRVSMKHGHTYEFLNDDKPIYNQIPYPDRRHKIAVDVGGNYRNGYQKIITLLNNSDEMRQASQFLHFKALYALRLLALNSDKELSDRILKNLKDINTLKDEIIAELRPVLAEGFDYDKIAFTRLDAFASADAATRHNFYAAIHLFPYARDQWGDPYFLKEYYRHLVNQGKFAEAEALLDDTSLLSNRIFPPTWKHLLLGRAYEKFGQTELAKAAYNNTRYLVTGEGRAALARLGRQSAPHPGSRMYSDQFYKNQKCGSMKACAEVVPILDKLFPKTGSVVDIGCGTGAWLAAFKKLGKTVFGYDFGQGVPANLLIPEDCFQTCDLSKSLKLETRYDLCLCLEVAEHLEEQFAKTLVKSLVDCSDIVIFSAAAPGQGGVNHVNCQWPQYWVELFAEQNYAACDVLRPAIWNNENIPYWYRQNMICYINKACPAFLTDLEGRTSYNCAPLLHPAAR